MSKPARQARALGYPRVEVLRRRGTRQPAAALLRHHRAHRPATDAYARDPLSVFFRRHGSAAEAAAMTPAGLDVVCLTPGRCWEYTS